MSRSENSKLAEILQVREAELLAAWAAELDRAGLDRGGDVRAQCASFIGRFRQAVRTGDEEGGPAYDGLRDLLATFSKARTIQGFSPTETATFVFALKKPLFDQLRKLLGDDPHALIDELWRASLVLDRLGLWTTEVHQQAREEIISRQQQQMLELSTPVVKLWGGILALPMIGTLDSSRTQVVMEALLQAIVETGSEVAVIDITGVPVVDTLVAQHLLKTVTAARLMGADCIISGIRPQIAQTIVHLGVDLSGVITKASMADALALAFRKLGYRVTKADDTKP